MADCSSSTPSLEMEPVEPATEAVEVGTHRTRAPVPTPRRSLVNLLAPADSVYASVPTPSPTNQREIAPKPKPRTRKPSVYENASLTPEGFIHLNSTIDNEKEVQADPKIQKHIVAVPGHASPVPRKILKPAAKSRLSRGPSIVDADAYGYNTGGVCVNKNLTLALPTAGPRSDRGVNILKCAIL